MTDDVITTDEQYSTATNASNLRVEADKRSQADILIAAGWSHSRAGMALLRLHSEYDGAKHAPAAAPDQLRRLVLSFDKGMPPMVFSNKGQAAHDAANMRRALQMVAEWQLHETALTLGRLKTLPEARARLIAHVELWKRPVESPADLVADVLMWWLDSVCPVCHGAERDRHGKAVCPSCRGSGRRKLPQGEAGRKLANLIDDSLSAARTSIKKRLHPARK